MLSDVVDSDMSKRQRNIHIQDAKEIISITVKELIRNTNAK